MVSSLCDTGSLLLTCYAGWLFGSSSRTKKEKSKSQDLEPYQSPAERAEKLKEGRAIDLAALLELKGLVQTQSVAFFTTWVQDGNPCDFAKVLLLSVERHQCNQTWHVSAIARLWIGVVEEQKHREQLSFKGTYSQAGNGLDMPSLIKLMLL